MILYYDVIAMNKKYKLKITASNKDCYNKQDLLDKVKVFIDQDPILNEEYKLISDLKITYNNDGIVELEALLQRI